MRDWRPTALLALAFCAATSRAEGDEADLKALFLREYPPAARMLGAAYSNARGTGVEIKTTEKPGMDGPAKSSKMRIEFAISGQWARTQIFDSAHETKPTIAFEKISCVGPSGAFRLRRHSKGATPEFKGVETGDEKGVRDGIDSFLDPYIKAASGSVEIILDDILTRSGQVVGVQESIIDGKKLFTVNYNYAFKIQSSPTPIPYVASVLFSPEDTWAIREYSFGPTQSPKVHQGKIEYDSPQRGIPRPKRIIEIITMPDNKPSGVQRGVRSITTTTFEFERLDLEPTPESEFTLAAFGLGKMESPPAKPPTKSNNGIWYFGLAALALVVAIGLKILASRRPKQGASAPPSGT